jgi:hypothetical protein
MQQQAGGFFASAAVAEKRALAVFAGLLALGAATPAQAELAMFSQRNFQGSSYALQAPGSSISFSPRSVRVLPGEPWELCPRPFFGGTCIVVTEADPKLNLPRGFSGMVRSARAAAKGSQASGAAPDSAPKKDPEP